MPIFNFENYWRDVKYRYVPESELESSSGGSGTESVIDGEAIHPPVFSGYFWVYFAVSVALSFVTIEVWWRVVSRNDSMPDGTKIPREKPPHWTVYPVWSLILKFR